MSSEVRVIIGQPVTLYDEGNAAVVGLLRVGGSPVDLYAAARIEKLEAEVERLSEPHCNNEGCCKIAAKYRAEVEGLEPLVRAYQRLRANNYLRWGNAGGPNECTHGRAKGIPCPDCDLRAVEEFEAG